MTFVRVEQRNAHLASDVRLTTIAGREGPVSKATLTAISNIRRGSGDNRGEEAVAVQWTVWGKQADNAAKYLGKGSHVNIVGRVQNNNYEREGQMVYGMAFTAEEIDYLDTKAEGEALRARQDDAPARNVPVPAPAQAPVQAQATAKDSAPAAKADKPVKGKKAPAKQGAMAGATDDIPF